MEDGPDIIWYRRSRGVSQRRHNLQPIVQVHLSILEVPHEILATDKQDTNY